MYACFLSPIGHVIQSKSIISLRKSLLIADSVIHIPEVVDGGEGVVIQRK